MKTEGTTTIKNKIHTYSLERQKDNSIRFICKSANINQDFLPEDIPNIIIDLPAIIIAEQEHSISKDSVIRFRVSSEDKLKIEQKAIKNGYTSVSKYLKDLALL